MKNIYSGDASNSSTAVSEIFVDQSLSEPVINDKRKINEDLIQPVQEDNSKNEDLCKSWKQVSHKSYDHILNKLLKTPTNHYFDSSNENLSKLKHEDCVNTNANLLLNKLTEEDLSKAVKKDFTSLKEKMHSSTKDASKVVNNGEKLSLDEGLNSNNLDNNFPETGDCAAKYQIASIPVLQDCMSNDTKKLWLNSTLSFIKNDKKVSLKYPKVPLAEAVFIEAVVDQNFKPDSDNDFKTLYVSIREAMTIFKNKYEFSLKTVAKTNTTVILSLEKVPKNDNISFKCTNNNTATSQLSEKRLKKRNKKIVDKLAIIDAVPMPFVLDSLQKILAFIEDTMNASIVFKKLSPKEWTFMMNIKAIVKMRHMLVNDMPLEVHKLLCSIGAHKDYGFNLALIGHDKSSKDRSVSLMKTPLFTTCIKNNKESCNDVSIRETLPIKSKEKFEEPAPLINNASNILLRAITKPLKDFSSRETSIEGSSRSRPTSSERSSLEIKSQGDQTITEVPNKDEGLYSRMEKSSNSSVESSSSPQNKAVHCSRDDTPASENQRKSSAIKSYHTSIERTLTAKPKTTIQFQQGGHFDASNEGSSISDTVKLKNKCFRGRSLDRRTDHMTNKLYEGLSIPLECEKAKRMMKLMGWNGGALGTRGEGITEPIMPEIRIVTGAGLGHTTSGIDNDKKNDSTKCKIKTRSRFFSYQEYDEMSMCNPALAPWKLNKDVETRVYILSNILEFVLSDQKQKVLLFDIPLIHKETDFLPPVIRSLNDGTDATLQTIFECGLFYKIQDVMVSKSDLTLGAYLTGGGKNLQILKLNENVADTINNSVTDECHKKYISLDLYVTQLKPKESYGDISNKAFRLFAFRLMMLDEILLFLESDEVAIIYNIVTMLFKKHLKFMSCFIDNLNMRRRERSSTPQENFVAEQIYNKLGDYCICFNVMRRHKQIKLQKKLRKTKGMNSCSLKIYGPDKAIDVLKMKENQQDKLIDKVQSVVKVGNQEKPQGSMEDEVYSKNNECKVNNTQIEKMLQDEMKLEASEAVAKENVICKRPIDFTEESKNLLKDIEELERSIAKVDHLNEVELNKYESSPDSKTELNANSDNTGKLNIYKCISITCKDPDEKITMNSVRTLQNVISQAIDSKDNFLPLLQCNGLVDDKLSYNCYNEETYLWIRTVIGDNYLIIDNTIDTEKTYRMQMKLRTFIDDGSETIMSRIMLYNPELDVNLWALESKVVSIDFILMEVQVDNDSFNFISKHNFSIFAGVDKVQFSVIWD